MLVESLSPVPFGFVLFFPFYNVCCAEPVLEVRPCPVVNADMGGQKIDSGIWKANTHPVKVCFNYKKNL